MKIAVVSDAWKPQRNGVVRVIESVVSRLETRGHEIEMITPDRFNTIPCPTYPEIRLALLPKRKVSRLLDDFAPDAVHIATEGPLGQAAKAHCLKRGWPFTTAYHSKFPEYINERTGVPVSWLYAWMRRFHKQAHKVFCPSPSVYRELTALGFQNALAWTHGVDTAIFRPRGQGFLAQRITDRDLPRPFHAYVGRVTVDKNIPGFLDLDLPGTKFVVGDGPSRESLAKRYPDIPFIIVNSDDELAEAYSDADVFVFPSKTDTFGLVMLEALACGTPVAALPVTGPLDVIGDAPAGVLDQDLVAASAQAISIPADVARAHAEAFSWEVVADQFLDHLAPIKAETRIAA
ncbi:MAG: glycosyltransferase family 4 protein [Magnetovibrionaceae bacterium]